jgi:hypothetical protein
MILAFYSKRLKMLSLCIVYTVMFICRIVLYSAVRRGIMRHGVTASRTENVILSCEASNKINK